VLHARQATILSFNYDNVVQGLVDDLCLGDWSGGNIGQLVTSDDIVDHLPPRALVSNAYWGAGQVVQSLRLLKLHGSLSWYWNPDDATGVTMARWLIPGFGKPFVQDSDARRWALPGRVGFIVP
jgi:hypothetical protein